MQVQATVTGSQAILWELKEYDGGPPIAVGPYASEAAARSAMDIAMRDRFWGTASIANSGMVDVTGRTRNVTVWNNMGEGDWLGHPPAIYQQNGQWYGTVTIPAGQIFIMYYSGASGLPGAPQ